MNYEIIHVLILDIGILNLVMVTLTNRTIKMVGHVEKIVYVGVEKK